MSDIKAEESDIKEEDKVKPVADFTNLRGDKKF